MKNYEEKEKRLDEVLNKLSSMSTRVSTSDNNNSKLNLHKNQLISEKEEAEKKYQILLRDHQNLKKQFDKVKDKIKIQNKVSEKIDELNQETEELIGEIDQW